MLLKGEMLMLHVTAAIDEIIMEKAVGMFKGRTRSEIISYAVSELVRRHEQKNLYDLFDSDEVLLAEDYDYKALRGGKLSHIGGHINYFEDSLNDFESDVDDSEDSLSDNIGSISTSPGNISNSAGNISNSADSISNRVSSIRDSTGNLRDGIGGLSESKDDLSEGEDFLNYRVGYENVIS